MQALVGVVPGFGSWSVEATSVRAWGPRWRHVARICEVRSSSFPEKSDTPASRAQAGCRVPRDHARLETLAERSVLTQAGAQTWPGQRLTRAAVGPTAPRASTPRAPFRNSGLSGSPSGSWLRTPSRDPIGLPDLARAGREFATQTAKPHRRRSNATEWSHEHEEAASPQPRKRREFRDHYSLYGHARKVPVHGGAMPPGGPVRSDSQSIGDSTQPRNGPWSKCRAP